MRLLFFRLVARFTILGLFLSPGSIRQYSQEVHKANAASPKVILTEGNDFATRVLGDPWDMTEFSDVSQYLNQSSQVVQLDSYAINNSVFSAHAAPIKQAALHLLFPGYLTALLVGKTGENYPIDANTYKCLFVAAKVDSGPPENGSPDQMVVYWFNDEKLNTGIWGQTAPGIWLYPETSSYTPTPIWKLFSLHLDQAQVPADMVRWENSPDGKWRGLRIDPTIQSTWFQIDWARLTDCQAVNLQISRPGNNPVSVYIRPAGTSREILVLRNTTANPIILDTQGFQVGDYAYMVKNGEVIISSGDFQIRPSPIATIITPSYSSGVDYSTETGNAWDMTDQADIVSTECTTSAMVNGTLQLNTPPPASQPPGCSGDPKIKLNTPIPVDASQYRYLTFRMNTKATIQNVPHAMIARIVWATRGVSGNPSSRCYLVSNDIPYDIGWQTITIDLHDPIQGTAEENTVIDCPQNMTWSGTSPMFEIRFDPNENTTDLPILQELDWVRLTKNDAVTKGKNYQVEIKLNLPWSELDYYNLFYTTDPSNAYQYNMILAEPGKPIVSLGKFPLYLPLVSNSPDLSLDPKTFLWDTSTVIPGEYYPCIQVTKNNIPISYCSKASIVVK